MALQPKKQKNVSVSVNSRNSLKELGEWGEAKGEGQRDRRLIVRIKDKQETNEKRQEKRRLKKLRDKMRETRMNTYFYKLLYLHWLVAGS